MVRAEVSKTRDSTLDSRNAEVDMKMDSEIEESTQDPNPFSFPDSSEKQGKPDDTVPPMASMAPQYPKHRDVLIIGGVIIILIIALAGGYLLLRGKGLPTRFLTKNPFKTLATLIIGPEAYEVAGAFLRENEDRFPQLGRIIGFSPTQVEVRSLNERTLAKIIIRVKGSIATRNVHFRLEKYERRWRIISVLLELDNGKFEMVYPQNRRKPPRS
jgi:hypothetical protein